MNDVLGLIADLRGRYSQKSLASMLAVDTRTLRRWEARETEPPPYLRDALLHLFDPDAESDRATANEKFKFIDLFAGIGGMRIAFQGQGGRCVFSSEWDKWAQKTYIENFPDSLHHMHGDITNVREEDVPDHDILLAGFPCQPFSIAGVSKKNSLGRAHGFADKTQGTLFFDVARIIAHKRPAGFLLENVKNLVSHDRGNTFRVIREVLEGELGYQIHWKVIDGAHFVPQHRERILIVGFREKTDFSWDGFRLPSMENGPRMRGILHPEDGSEEAELPYTVGAAARVSSKYILSEHLWTYLRNYAAKHKAAGNGFGYGLIDGDSVSRTLSARYHKDGSEILVSRGPRSCPRRLTPRECARLMGFDCSDRKIKIPVSDTQAYRQFGNSVVVPVIEEVARVMIPSVLRITGKTRPIDRQSSLYTAGA